jgi:DNA mismatch repair protein MutL
MAVIRILPDKVANQIAAGEVIERPASIVKELLENSLDAGATKIEIEFKNGGRSLIKIEDNGSGMSREDALLSLERHATSKIKEASDLDSVLSFGFRGEALPSMASICRFLLQTRTKKEDHGTEVLVNGGKVVHVKECGMPVGTRIAITQLFNTVPARRKFLKTDRTEAAHVIQNSRLYALANPQVSFTLMEDSRITFQSPVCSSLSERVTEIFGKQIGQQLLPIKSEDKDLHLYGLIGKPGIGRSSKHEMITFVNHRPVDNRTIGYALIESYHTLIQKGRYPLAFLFLDIDPAGIDVNVHPAKKEIRFRDEGRIRSFIIRSIMEHLRPKEASITSFSSISKEVSTKETKNSVAVQSSAVVEPLNEQDKPTKIVVDKSNTKGIGAGSIPVSIRKNSVREKVPDKPLVRAEKTIGSPKASSSNISDWQHLGTIMGGYSLFETASGLVVLDHRSAHERVLFERLKGQYEASSSATQKLLLSVPFELDPIESVMLTDHQGFFDRHGFEIAPFGRNFFRIEGVPSWLEPGKAEDFMRDAVNLIRQGRISEAKPDLATNELVRLALKQSIFGGDEVKPQEAVSLLKQLFACQDPHTSASGRPTYIEVSKGELDRRFQKRLSKGQLDVDR